MGGMYSPSFKVYFTISTLLKALQFLLCALLIIVFVVLQSTAVSAVYSPVRQCTTLTSVLQYSPV